MLVKARRYSGVEVEVESDKANAEVVLPIGGALLAIFVVVELTDGRSKVSDACGRTMRVLSVAMRGGEVVEGSSWWRWRSREVWTKARTTNAPRLTSNDPPTPTTRQSG
jgi:hypothetical protein